jgi:hypothetical protein
MKIVGIDALVVLGGEGTLTIAKSLQTRRSGLRCAEDDRQRSRLHELTFGFVTALDIATEALDRLHTTAESHDRVMILEVMGRTPAGLRCTPASRAARRDPDSGDSLFDRSRRGKDSPARLSVDRILVLSSSPKALWRSGTTDLSGQG